MEKLEQVRYKQEDILTEAEVVEMRERYSGVCDVYSQEEARAMADELRKNRKNPNRKFMVGVMTHPLALNPERGRGIPECDGVREVFPKRENLAGGFTDDPDVLNTIHYADLYGPFKGQNLFENLEAVVKFGGENLHAIQVDVTWPDTAAIKKFKEKYPNIAIVLQVGKFALKEIDGKPEVVVDKLLQYGTSVDYVLLDMSMGKGKGMEAGGLLPLLRTLRKELPYLGLAVAGGLGPDSVDELAVIAKEFPDVSIDAQGNVKSPDAPRDSLGHLLATHPAELGRSKEYIAKSCNALDNPKNK